MTAQEITAQETTAQETAAQEMTAQQAIPMNDAAPARRRPARTALLSALIPALLSGCSLAPDMEMPSFALPASFRHDAHPRVALYGHPDAQGEWQEAAPREQAPRGAWWTMFGDPRLDALQERAAAANPGLAAAAARVDQARGLARANAPGWLPNIGIGANAVRTAPSANGQAGMPATPYTLYDAGASASYEVDLFRRLHDNERALRLDADAQEAAYRSVLLALQADVAQLYFTIRALDADRAVLRDAVQVRAEAARIMKRRLETGDATTQDDARTESELESTRAELLATERQRANAEHMMATLLGELPSSFTLEEHVLDGAPPPVPGGLPAQLLTRRPDIGGAVSAMAAANARIGAARAAFLPALSLTASGGYQAGDLGDLFAWSSRTWALGQIGAMALTLPLFDNGRRAGNLDRAEAAYEEAVANYRAQVLAAFREVEDNLAGQKFLADQFAHQDRAAHAATRTYDLTLRRYDAGDADYFEVVDAQRSALATRRAAIQLRGQRFTTAVALIRALGGGWDDAATAAVSGPAPGNATPGTAAPDTPPPAPPAQAAPAQGPDSAPVPLQPGE